MNPNTTTRTCRAAAALAHREWLAFLRRPSRIVATVGTPLLVWLFLLGGFGNLTTNAGAFAAYALPGMALLVVMFATVFASISLINDRTSGFLRAAAAIGTPTTALVTSKLITGVALAALQGAIVLAAIPTVAPAPSPLGWAIALAGLALGAAACVAVGLALACLVQSTEGFHGVMNLVLMPLWLLSGAFTPPDTGARWFNTITALNPIASILAVMRTGIADAPIAPWQVVYALAFTTATLALAWLALSRRLRNA